MIIYRLLVLLRHLEKLLPAASSSAGAGAGAASSSSAAGAGAGERGLEDGIEDRD